MNTTDEQQDFKLKKGDNYCPKCKRLYRRSDIIEKDEVQNEVIRILEEKKTPIFPIPPLTWGLMQATLEKEDLAVSGSGEGYWWHAEKIFDYSGELAFIRISKAVGFIRNGKYNTY